MLSIILKKLRFQFEWGLVQGLSMRENQAVKYFILYGGYDEQVIRGQVVGHLLAAKKRGHKIEVVFLQHEREIGPARFRHLDELDIEYKVIGASPPKNLAGQVIDGFRVSKYIANVDRAKQRGVVIHARGEDGAVAGSYIKMFLLMGGFRVKLIFDWRGDAWEEFKYRYESREKNTLTPVLYFLKHAVITLKRALLFAFSDACIAVTNVLVERSRIKASYLMPAYASQDLFANDESVRLRMRSKFGLNGAVVFCYAGSIQPYQELEQMLDFMVSMFRRDARARFVVVTNDLGKAGAVIEAFGGDFEGRILLVSAAHEEVGDYLCMADVALLIRRPAGINYYSFPTKFIEYLYSGLPVVTTEAVPIVVSYMNEHSCGAVVKYGALGTGISESQLARLLSMDRGRISREAKEYFSDEERFKIYNHLYQLA